MTSNFASIYSFLPHSIVAKVQLHSSIHFSRNHYKHLAVRILFCKYLPLQSHLAGSRHFFHLFEQRETCWTRCGKQTRARMAGVHGDRVNCTQEQRSAHLSRRASQLMLPWLVLACRPDSPSSSHPSLVISPFVCFLDMTR